ncbi:hypothetical protein DHL47_09900 [Streptococcus panodentis]|uniref:Uncharacterized protein n=1 Tax=Streptococcus panodentis TaxID=1581472 RepID=A0ABS5AYW2_9STRE|nr:hypothetical protein [Streptococcus panodentis]
MRRPVFQSAQSTALKLQTELLAGRVGNTEDYSQDKQNLYEPSSPAAPFYFWPQAVSICLLPDLQ